MDRLRLVMPPTLFALLQHPFTRLAHNLFPNWMANGIIAGSFAFYVAYDVMHYALHHTKLPEVRLFCRRCRWGLRPAALLPFSRAASADHT